MVRACGGLDLVLFADDTNIFAEGSDPAELFGRVDGTLWSSADGAIGLL